MFWWFSWHFVAFKEEILFQALLTDFKLQWTLLQSAWTFERTVYGKDYLRNDMKKVNQKHKTCFHWQWSFILSAISGHLLRIPILNSMELSAAIWGAIMTAEKNEWPLPLATGFVLVIHIFQVVHSLIVTEIHCNLKSASNTLLCNTWNFKVCVKDYIFSAEATKQKENTLKRGMSFVFLASKISGVMYSPPVIIEKYIPAGWTGQEDEQEGTYTCPEGIYNDRKTIHYILHNWWRPSFPLRNGTPLILCPFPTVRCTVQCEDHYSYWKPSLTLCFFPDNTIHAPIHRPIHPSIHPSNHSSIHPTRHPSINSPLHPSIYLSIYISIYQSQLKQ